MCFSANEPNPDEIFSRHICLVAPRYPGMSDLNVAEAA